MDRIYPSSKDHNFFTEMQNVCPVYKKGDKLDCANYRGICLLNVAYKVFAKVLYDRLLPHANAVVQHYQAGFQSGKSTTDQLFALRQILEKGNEHNIPTHHLFIDLKAAYDTIIRNEVYVSMLELDFPTKLIRLTKATLTTVLCCSERLSGKSGKWQKTPSATHVNRL
jgi:Reverse transcriptase (RNA-dependent DNA polymerase)